MNPIRVMKIAEIEKQTRGISKWPIWEKEISTFDWYYDQEEHCLILSGRCTVTSAEQQVEIKSGDYVIFPKGLHCAWKIIEPIRKHYQFL